MMEVAGERECDEKSDVGDESEMITLSNLP